jgi:hypothetical protein
MRQGRWIVAWSWRESYMPVFGGGDLRGIVLVAVDKPTEEFACSGGVANLEQEVSHHWHSIAAEDESLNIRKIQRGCD